MNEWKQYLVAKGWVPNSDTTLWLDPLSKGVVYTTATAFKIQYVERDKLMPPFPE